MRTKIQGAFQNPIACGGTGKRTTRALVLVGGLGGTPQFVERVAEYRRQVPQHGDLEVRLQMQAMQAWPPLDHPQERGPHAIESFRAEEGVVKCQEWLVAWQPCHRQVGIVALIASDSTGLLLDSFASA